MGCNTDKPNCFIGYSKVEPVETIYKDNIYTRLFYGNTISNTFDISSYPAWDENKTDYKIGDKVVIQELRSVYTCGKDGSMLYPPSTSEWLPSSCNKYKHLDDIPTTKSISTNDVVEVVYDAIYANYIIGQFIDGVERIEIYSLYADTLEEKELLSTIKMTQIIDFTCFTCCNPPPSIKRNFVFSLKEKSCSDRFVKVKLFKSGTAAAIKVGTLVVVRALSAGILLKDPKVNINRNIDFKYLKLTQDIFTYTMGSTVEFEADLFIKGSDKKRLWDYQQKYSSLQFIILDTPQLEILESTLMGAITLPKGFSIGLDKDTEYTINLKGVIA